jgi:broad specificity phosphatase PhoE
MSEVDGFPPDIAEIAWKVFHICRALRDTPSLAAAHQSAEWIDLGLESPSPILADPRGRALELSSFRKHILGWEKKGEEKKEEEEKRDDEDQKRADGDEEQERADGDEKPKHPRWKMKDCADPTSWMEPLFQTRNGYILARRLQGATHRVIADELDVSHTAVIKAWRRYIASGDVPPLINIPFVERRPRQADKKARAEAALLVLAWRLAPHYLMACSHRGVCRALTAILTGGDPRRLSESDLEIGCNGAVWRYQQSLRESISDHVSDVIEEAPDLEWTFSEEEIEEIERDGEEQDRLNKILIAGAQQSLHDYYSPPPRHKSTLSSSAV